MEMPMVRALLYTICTVILKPYSIEMSNLSVIALIPWALVIKQGLANLMLLLWKQIIHIFNYINSHKCNFLKVGPYNYFVQDDCPKLIIKRHEQELSLGPFAWRSTDKWKKRFKDRSTV